MAQHGKHVNIRGRRMTIIGAALVAVSLVAAFCLAITAISYDRDTASSARRDAHVAASYSRALKARELARAHTYNKALYTRQKVAGLDLGATYTGDRLYQSELRAPQDIMATVRIPRIAVTLPVYHGSTPAVLDRGLGHLPGTSLPVGGRNTRAVIVGHRGLPGKTLFTRLPELQKGDMFFVTVLGKTLAYKVHDEVTVLPSQASEVKIRPGRDAVTLLTCTPYGVNTHRLLVTGYRVPWNPHHIPAQGKPWGWLDWAIPALLLAASVALIGRGVYAHRHPRRALHKLEPAEPHHIR